MNNYLYKTIQNIYINVIKPLFSIEIQTEDNKWNNIKSINKTELSQFYKISTKSYQLICTKNHILIDEFGNQIFAIESLNKNIKTSTGIEQVISVEKDDIIDYAYDVTLDGDNLYYANGILSHNCVVSDEFAFVPNNIASKVFESIYPVISSSKNSQFIIVSTPNGADPKNLYYNIWSQANNKTAGGNSQGWKAFRFDWWDVPGRDEQWKLNTIASIGQQRFSQEFGNEFLVTTSIKKLITDDIIEKHRIKLSEYKTQGFKPKIQRIVSLDESELFEFKMWHEFQPNKTYLASADIAEGIGGDSSVLYIWDVTDLSNITMCAMFSSNSTSLVQFAYVAHKMLSIYNNPPLAAERNGVSAGMLDSLRITYGYQNIIAENKKNEPGIYSHVTVKGKACLWARDMMTTPCFGFTIYDKDLLDEFSIFVKKDTQSMHNIYHALPGQDSHDDHVMAFIWCTYALHNDRVQNIFTVIDTVTTQLGQVYAKLLQPLNAYIPTDINKITNDPLYKEFLEYKEELNTLGLKALQIEQQENANDIFVYANSQDAYFGDIDGDSWNNTPLNYNMDPNYMNRQHTPNINLGGNHANAPIFFVS